jgi:hypothetical protein
MVRTTHKEGNQVKSVTRGPMARRKAPWAVPAATLLVTLLSLGVPRPAAAVFDPLDPDPRSRAMGGASTGTDAGPFAIYHNPAALEVTDALALGVTYVQPYGLGFLKMTVASVAAPLPGRFGGIGFGFRRLATDYMDQSLDEQNTFSVAHGFNLHQDVSSTVAVGYGLNLFSLKFGPSVTDIDPGSATSFGIDLAARVTLRNRTAIGFMAQNVNNPTIGDSDVEELPRRVCGGISYSPYSGVVTTLDMDSVLGQKTRFRGGSEFELTRYGHVRLGIATDPNIYSAGLGVHYRGIQFNYGFSSGPGPLDESHQVGVTLTPGLLTGNGEE